MLVAIKKMDNLLIIIILIYTVILGFLNYLKFKIIDTDLVRFEKTVYLFVVILALIEFILVLIIAFKDITLLFLIRIILLSILFNISIFLFPIIKKYKNKKIISNSIYFFQLLFYLSLCYGLYLMTSPANTWGNSNLFSGLIISFFSIQNLFLFCILKQNLYIGIFKIIVSILTITLIVLNLKINEYNSNSEQLSRIVVFVICFYLIIEGLFNFGKNKILNNF